MTLFLKKHCKRKKYFSALASLSIFWFEIILRQSLIRKSYKLLFTSNIKDDTKTIFLHSCQYSKICSDQKEVSIWKKIFYVTSNLTFLTDVLTFNIFSNLSYVCRKTLKHETIVFYNFTAVPIRNILCVPCNCHNLDP